MINIYAAEDTLHTHSKHTPEAADSVKCPKGSLAALSDSPSGCTCEAFTAKVSDETGNLWLLIGGKCVFLHVHLQG